MLDFSQNYFALFGLPVGFNLDTQLLASRYRDLQRVAHPDRHAHASAQERRLAVQGAGHINEAFETLKDPLARARYLLGLHGAAPTPGQDSSTDPAFLMAQMELREALAEVPSQPDPHRRLAEILDHIQAQRRALIGQLSTQLAATPDPTQLEAAREGVRRLQFLDKLAHQAQDLEAHLDDLAG